MIPGQHVKAHLDDITDDLTPAQELNKRMDIQAGQFVQGPIPQFFPHHAPPLLLAQQVVLLKNNIPFATNIVCTLISGNMTVSIKNYFQTHHGIPAETFCGSQWKSIVNGRKVLQKYVPFEEYVMKRGVMFTCVKMNTWIV